MEDSFLLLKLMGLGSFTTTLAFEFIVIVLFSPISPVFFLELSFSFWFVLIILL